MAWRPSKTTAAAVGIALALVGNMATNTVSVDEPWWPYAVWGVVAALAAVVLAEHRRPPAEDDLVAIADRLAAVVRGQWQDEVARRSLNDPYPLPVRWDPAPADLVADWADITRLAVNGIGRPQTGDRAAWAASADELAGGDVLAAWRKVPTGRLVVLGAPGTGKTVLLARFVVDLLDPTTRVKGSPVPVLVSIAAWNPAEKGLADWMVERLAVDHPALDRGTATGTPLLRQLMGRELVFPVLDGLDEIPQPLRAEAIAELNAVLAGGTPLVISSRTDAYRDAIRPPGGAEVTLTGAAGIRLRALDAEDVISYLRSSAGGPVNARRWDRVAAALPRGGALAEVMRTPLMTTLARDVHNPRRGAGTADLPSPDVLVDLPDREAIEQHLFDGFVPAAYRPHPTRPTRWHPEQAVAWLGHLAFHLERNRMGQPDFAWWQLHLRTRPRSPSRGAALAVCTVTGLVAGIATTALYSSAYSNAYFVWTGLTVCVTAYLVFGSVWWLTDRFGAALTASAATAISGGLAIDIVGDLVIGPTTPVLLIAAGLASGFAYPLRRRGPSPARAGIVVGLVALVVYTALYATNMPFPGALNAASADATLTGLLVLVAVVLTGARTGRSVLAFIATAGVLRGSTAWFAGSDGREVFFTDHQVVVALAAGVTDAALVAVVVLVAHRMTRPGGGRRRGLVCLLVVLVVGAGHGSRSGLFSGILAALPAVVGCLLAWRPVAARDAWSRLGLGLLATVIAVVGGVYAVIDIPDQAMRELPAPIAAAVVVTVLGAFIAKRDHEPRDWLRTPLLSGVGYGAVHTLFYGPVYGLAVGVVVGLAVELVDRQLASDTPARGLRLAERGLVLGLAVSAVLTALLVWRYDVVTAALLGLVVGGAVGIAYGMEAPRTPTAVRTPAEVLARDRTVFLVSTAVVTVAVTVATGFVAGSGSGFDVTTGLVGGLTYGAATGVFVAAGRTQWLRYFIARCALALTGRVPWRLMAFLEDAHTVHGVLRQNGATYQFRHLDVQRRLAATYVRSARHSR
ncbi:NACHT domain-containing protein [Saccharothrix syringae]|uniref:NACHT domain-containing protein n=1 Tax=Saccharothrix syringae TaxID=103733 RepID=A0A5Q0H9I3_SACSY|nr:NACHT domain-containing protein [Saccharothrix syringae]QFZ22896.1 NACHT domain-containing protein [Saccharothrix syringae]